MNEFLRTIRWAVLLWILGIGATVWLGVWVSFHEFNHEQAQESRAAVVTGAIERPTSQIKLKVVPKDCTHITSADIDGKRLTLYAKNDCHQNFDYMEWHWQSLSPNGTAIHAGYQNTAFCPVPRKAQLAECVMELSDDDRTLSIEVWTEASLR